MVRGTAVEQFRIRVRRALERGESYPARGATNKAILEEIRNEVESARTADPVRPTRKAKRPRSGGVSALAEESEPAPDQVALDHAPDQVALDHAPDQVALDYAPDQVATLTPQGRGGKRTHSGSHWAEKRSEKEACEEQVLRDAMATVTETGEVSAGLTLLRQSVPMLLVRSFNSIEAMLKTCVRPKHQLWALPDLTAENVVLWPWQSQLWELLAGAPVARRIIWVAGGHDTGKSHMYNYLVANYKYGVYAAGKSASFDSCVYGYRGEGCILWDLPRTFEYDKFGDSLAYAIEKFSDFGRLLTSKKYQGRSEHVRGHVVVFANRECLEALEHRSIVNMTAQRPVNMAVVDETVAPSSKRSKRARGDETVERSPIGHGQGRPDEALEEGCGWVRTMSGWEQRPVTFASLKPNGALRPSWPVPAEEISPTQPFVPQRPVVYDLDASGDDSDCSIASRPSRWPHRRPSART